MFDDFEIIHRYTRNQAIKDGVLLDVSDAAREAGFRHPVALTTAVWGRYVAVPDGMDCQDEAGRLWDLLFMLAHTVRQTHEGDTLLFTVLVQNDDGGPQPVTLIAVCGPDDDGSPCLTIMLPEED